MKSLGYGRSLRPYLNQDHENGTTTEIDTETDLVGTDASGIKPNYTGDEWTYSKAAVAVPMEEDSSSAGIYPYDLVDTYTFTLCDDSHAEVASDSESGTAGYADSFKSVGMLREWLTSFKKSRATTANADEQVTPDNALLQLISQQGADKEEVLELAKDSQAEQRPWDLNGSTHYSLQGAGYARATNGESGYMIFQAPCGLFSLLLQNDHLAAENTKFTFEVLDIQDM